MTSLAPSEPFAPPRLKTGSEYAYHDGQTRRLSGFAKPLSVLLVLYALVAGLLGLFALYGLLDPRLLDEDALVLADPEEDLLLLLVASGFFFAAVGERLIFFVCVFFVCRFSYRAMRNLYTVRSAIPEMSPAASVYWYFVPIAFWFMPSAGMSQIYNGSIAETGRENTSRLVSYWWAAWVICVFALMVANFSETPLTVFYPALAVAMVSAITAALLLRILVRRIAEAQTSLLQTSAAQVFA